MPLAVNDIVQHTILGEKDGQAVLNVLHFRVTTGPSTGTPAENLSALNDFLWDNPGGFYTDEFLGVLPADYILRGVRSQVVAPVRQAYVEDLLVYNGTLAGEQLETANLAWVIVKQTEFAGRRGRGTMHMVLPQAAWAQNGFLFTEGAAERALWVAKLDDLITIPAGGILEPVIFHPGFSPNFHRITHATAKTEIRVMRRRTVGHGI